MFDLTNEEWKKIDNCIFAIYNTKELELMQHKVMQILSVLIPHHKSFFDLCYNNGERFYFFRPISLNMTEEQITTYYEQYQYSDYIAWTFNSDSPLVYQDTDIVDSTIRKNSTIYKKWMIPMGVCYSMGCTIVSNHIMFGSITLFRNDNNGRFEEKELDILRIINRHLSANFSSRFPYGIKKESINNKNDIIKKYGLTKRESEIVEEIILGKNNLEIGKKLYISENTVKKHINNLYKKIGITTRSQLMTIYYNNIPSLDYMIDKTEDKS